MTRILIADDHPLAREGLKAILNGNESYDLVGEVASADDILPAVKRHEPDVLILDLSMPGRDFLSVLGKIEDSHPDLRVLVVTMHNDTDYLVRALRAGAVGYLTKGAPPSEIHRALEAVAEGREYVCPDLALELGKTRSEHAPHHMLSRREFQVLRLSASGHSVNAIAQELGITNKTVSTYRGRILKKLGLETFPEAIRYAVERGLLDRS